MKTTPGPAHKSRVKSEFEAYIGRVAQIGVRNRYKKTQHLYSSQP
jgi:hypothetical protein